MKLFPLPRAILIIFFLSLCYWIYLACSTSMHISCDAIGYQNLGRLLKENGFLPYFQTGPNREPIYPSLVALSMHVASFTGIAYTRIMAFFGVAILLLSQILVYLILRKLNVRSFICTIILGYFSLSPALNNTAFSLYSEVSSLPFVLLLILTIANSFETIRVKRTFQNFLSGLGLSLLFLCATLIKSPFEIIFFVFIGLYFFFFITALLQKNRRIVLNSLIFLLTFCTVYEVSITTYKMLNKIYNDHYTITNRGSWALYGSCALKTEPLTTQKLLTDLAHVPGIGACYRFFPVDQCDYWEPQNASDFFGMTIRGEVSAHTPAKDVDNVILLSCKKRILEHPFQFFFLSTFDWLKMFFWESTSIGFVSYPLFISKIYNIGLFKDGLRLFLSLLSLSSFLLLLRFIKKPLALANLNHLSTQESYLRFTIFIIILSYTSFHALFNTVTRWALPIAPLYLICIGYALQQLLPQRKNKNQSS